MGLPGWGGGIWPWLGQCMPRGKVTQQSSPLGTPVNRYFGRGRNSGDVDFIFFLDPNLSVFPPSFQSGWGTGTALLRASFLFLPFPTPSALYFVATERPQLSLESVELPPCPGPVGMEESSTEVRSIPGPVWEPPALPRWHPWVRAPPVGTGSCCAPALFPALSGTEQRGLAWKGFVQFPNAHVPRTFFWKQ